MLVTQSHTEVVNRANDRKVWLCSQARKSNQIIPVYICNAMSICFISVYIGGNEQREIP